MLSNISGFIFSAVVHILLAALVLNITESTKPSPPIEKPVVLTLAMFKPETRLAPRPEKIIKKKLVQKELEPFKKTRVAKIKPAVEKHIKPKVVKPPKPVKLKPAKKRKVGSKRLKKNVKPKKIKRLKLKRKKTILQKRHNIQTKPPIKRIARPLKRVVVRSPVRKVQRTTVNKKAYQLARHSVHRTVPRKVVSVRKAHKKILHFPRQSAPLRRIVKPPVRTAVKKPRVVAASVKPGTKVITQASGQALKRYKSRLRQLIEANKRYPKRAKRRREQGTAIVSFVMFSNGQVKNINISKSSGSSMLDTAAKKAVSKVSGKLPFTSGINKQQWQFTVPIVYRLR